MGDFRVHRIRFFNYEPSPINCLAFCNSLQKLAVCRANGLIEIWNHQNDWLQELVLCPPVEDSVSEVVTWCGSRLFSAGLHAKVFEHNLSTGTVTSTAFSNSGAIWCLVADSKQKYLAAGTEDGCVVIFSVISDGVIYDRQLDKQESRIICLAWHEPTEVIVSGGIDNIRIWSLKSGHAIQRLTLGRTERNKETLVWTLCVTNDFTIVSGDSQGRVCFWNGRQGTLIKSFRSHQADVLSLCMSTDGSSIFAAGVDPILVQFEWAPVTEGGEWKNWVRTNVRSQHSHDVRCVALAGDWIASGGVDCRLVLNKIDKKRGLVYSRKLPPFPMSSSLAFYASQAHQLLLRYPTHVELWQLGTTAALPGKDDEVLPLQSVPIKLLQLKSSSSQLICNCAVSSNGNWVAYSSSSGMRLFSINRGSHNDSNAKVSVSRIKSFPSNPLLPACLMFAPDNSSLIIGGYDGSIQKIILTNDNITLDYIYRAENNNETTSITRTIRLMAFSVSGKFLASSDLEGNIKIFNMKKNKMVCSLLKYSSLPTAMCFSPSSQELMVAYADLKVFEFSIKTQEMTLWSRQNDSLLQRSRGHPLFQKIVWLQYDFKQPQRILFADHQTLCIVDKIAGNDKGNKIATKDLNLIHPCTKFRYILHVELAIDNYLIVVERPPVTLMECLPATLKKKKFGT